MLFCLNNDSAFLWKKGIKPLEAVSCDSYELYENEAFVETLALCFHLIVI